MKQTGSLTMRMSRTHGKTPESPADHFLRIVAECRPRFVLRENPSVTRKDAPWPWWRVRDALEEIGYIVLPFGIRACCVGLHHRRDRLFLLGELQVSERTGLEGNVSEIMARALEGRQNTDTSRSDRRHPSPRICRGVDGIPHRVDRLKALGNAGVPDVAEKIGHIIMAALSGLRRSVLWFPKRGIMRDFYELHFLLFSLKHGGMSF